MRLLVIWFFFNQLPVNYQTESAICVCTASRFVDTMSIKFEKPINPTMDLRHLFYPSKDGLTFAFA
jgi:hypothetical protein